MGYQYTAIGDSLTTGFGALPGNGFVPVYRRMAENSLGTTVSSLNLGINGLTTADLEYRIRTQSLYRKALQESELITLSVGGNDLIRAAKSAAQQGGSSRVLSAALQECKRNFAGIIGMIAEMKSRSREPYIIRIVGLYNPYPEYREATDWVLHFNRYVSQYRNSVCDYASIYHHFAGNEKALLSLDHLHPNGRGYSVIARQLHGLGYGRL